MNKNLLSMGIVCLCTSLTAPASLYAQTCTTNAAGSLTTSSNWTCTGGATYLTATTLNVQNAMTVPSTVTMSSLLSMNVSGSGSLTFGNNAQLIVTNNAIIYLASASNTISGPGNSSNYYISLNGTPVWGKGGGVGGADCLGTLSGSGRLTAANPCAIVAGNPLPLELVSFSAALQGSNAVISFATAQEKNIAGFTIERSTDGKTFAAASSLIAAHNTSESQAYGWTDDQPQYGYNYYRLKTLEMDGTFSYSNTAVVNLRTSLTQPMLYPNPAKDQVTLNMGSTSGTTVASVKDLLGREYSVSSTNDGAAVHIDISALQPGNYVIQLAGNQQAKYMRFVKY